MKKLVYSVDECASVLGVSRSHVYRLVNDGRIKSIEIGNRKVIPISSLEDLLKTKINLSSPIDNADIQSSIDDSQTKEIESDKSG